MSLDQDGITPHSLSVSAFEGIKILVIKQCCNLDFPNSNKMYPYVIGKKVGLIEVSCSFTLVLF